MSDRLPDVRRTIRLEKHFTGQELADALKQFAAEQDRAYREILILDLDGEQSFRIGLSSKSPYKNVELRYGPRLESHDLAKDKPYTRVGVASSNEMIPDTIYAVGYGDKCVVDAVEEVRDGLEGILAKEE